MKPDCTSRQGQYLAFIYQYTKVNGRPPAQADMQQYFRVSPILSSGAGSVVQL